MNVVEWFDFRYIDSVSRHTTVTVTSSALFAQISMSLYLYNKNTTTWNMSDPVCAPMACNIVANDILKTA